MRITIIAVGRARKGPETDLVDIYAKRLPWPLEVREVDEKKKLPPAKLKEREAQLLLAAVPKGATVVMLDERGRTPGSVEFAKKVGAWRDQGTSDLVFLIGGADGHGDAVRARADYAMSLGKMTWPHMLVRPLIAEQLFRAQSILAGHPYHRE